MRGKNSRKALSEIAARYGFVFDSITGRNHLRWHNPQTGAFHVTVADLGNCRNLKNTERDFKNKSATRSPMPAKS